ncbi:hypothetical protein CPAR01_08714 [Colletotrichum paranaense]|uniref:Uncharacterized protein n=5 Tax=Colletotrichum acutatum species complex TaxID=2707335 RepID=A0AAI9ZCC3_9PEZI|nr:uncharacterized protein CCOS01_01114 [Colletotrichum costaricense]XP_060349351.1 uncharacterized protein CPAR01_08714 [Colletotrichum paranaense]XP_060384899.1 uncharacterized protein CTAM01_04224 [Colletotrichum tamarilloi]KAK0376946.1 hypothetical protein CLIM01_05671 [Colletotrichum limetticola]KAK1454135.1 hypothetical protein CMEL01_05794 [Colletotrichum melonis]KAK1503994.1 hypothetical protein CTAM01_04224 [Colletotrichum tamarilloi]KAK1538601.1 hypothetical protein CPAR01_08714 [Co
MWTLLEGSVSKRVDISGVKASDGAPIANVAEETTARAQTFKPVLSSEGF